MHIAMADSHRMSATATVTTPIAKEGAKKRAVSPLNGQPVPRGRQKGTPNYVTKTIREAIELSCQPGQCHPQGLAGWLIERARGGVQDRQIYAGLVAKVIPAQLQASVDGNIVVQLPWLTARNIGGRGTSTAQTEVIDAQVVDIVTEKNGNLRVSNPRPALEAPDRDPPPPVERQGGEG